MSVSLRHRHRQRDRQTDTLPPPLPCPNTHTHTQFFAAERTVPSLIGVVNALSGRKDVKGWVRGRPRGTDSPLHQDQQKAMELLSDLIGWGQLQWERGGLVAAEEGWGGGGGGG